MLLAGCQKSVFVQEPDLFDAQKRLNLPLQPENDPTIGSQPLVGPVSEPATVTNPDRLPRYITLREAIAIALESGTIGRQTSFRVEKRPHVLIERVDIDRAPIKLMIELVRDGCGIGVVPPIREKDRTL